MKKIAIIACKMIRGQNLCPGDVRCLVAFNRREGEFERYKENGAQLLGIIDCAGCEGNKTRVIPAMALLKLQLNAFNENLDALHVGTCMMKFCPRRDDLLAAIKEKAGIEVIEGTHTYTPPTIFGK
ncbi:MAG: CGGC domain-containing protein [Thermodesulfobacteriaceae bacterium]|nr:CGGC domain-containing protein [Thermodesulfobacteriaceae bacterium]MDW8136071.1 CGGC domain-containing protein [Thermodesulfobacterium sp.]